MVLQTNIISLNFKYKEDCFPMSKKTITLSPVAMGIIAIIAGILVIFWWSYAQFIIGVFLIVWGILSIINK